MIVKKAIKQKSWMLQSWQNNDKIKRCEINKSNFTMLNKIVKKLEEKNLECHSMMSNGFDYKYIGRWE
jgi:hypothetical protein